MAMELNQGKDVSEAIITGMACGAANALNLVSGHLNPVDVAQLRDAVQVERIN
jgi:fructose-1-phosphate kinase PfkB-like protein